MYIICLSTHLWWRVGCIPAWLLWQFHSEQRISNVPSRSWLQFLWITMQKWDYSIIQCSIFNFLKNLPAVFHSRRNILRFCRQDSKVSLWSTFSCPVLTYPFDDSILKAAGNTSLWFWFALHRRSVMLTIFIFHMLVGHFVYFLWRNVSLGPLFIFTIRSLVFKCINFGTVCFGGWRLTTRPWKALSSCAGCLGLGCCLCRTARF